MTPLDISKILVRTKYRFPTYPNDLAVYVVDIPKASEKICKNIFSITEVHDQYQSDPTEYTDPETDHETLLHPGYSVPEFLHWLTMNGYAFIKSTPKTEI